MTNKDMAKFEDYFTYQAQEELMIPYEVVALCSQQGDMGENVKSVLENNEEIRIQFYALDKEKVKYSLKEYGAWEDDDLQDHQTNLERLLWCSCCDISEEINAFEDIDYSKPIDDWQTDC